MIILMGFFVCMNDFFCSQVMAGKNLLKSTVIDQISIFSDLNFISTCNKLYIKVVS